jgi:hypothetical protein
MKKLLAAALLLVLGLSWTPLTLALLAAGAHHRCCHRMHLESTQQVTAPAICGSGRCCVSSDRTTTLPAVSPAPRLEMQTMGFVPVAPVEAVAAAITPDAVSPSRSCFDLSTILRI